MDRLSSVIHVSVRTGVCTVLSRLPYALLACLPVTASAISVGNIEINSSLNQPLSAKIDINFSPGENVPEDRLSVRIASPDQHHRNGLVYPTALNGADFSKDLQPDGVELHLHTNRPIQEPLLNFLLQIDWPAGRLLKEVPLFLDPPGYQILPTAAASPRVAAAEAFPVTRVALEPTQTFQIAEAYYLEDEVQPEASAPARPAPRKSSGPSRSITIKDGQYGPVRPGDSLSKIARAAAGRGAGKQEIDELMRAIYFVNPDAFLGSVDELEAGSFLLIPDPSEVPAQALQTFDHSSLAMAAPSVPKVVSDLAPPDREPVISADSTVDETPAEPTETPTQETQLSILPEDQAAQEIARELSERMEETARVANVTEELPISPISESTSGVDAEKADLIDTLNQAAEEALIADVQSLKEENAALKGQVESLSNDLVDTQQEVKRLELRVERLSELQSRLGLGDESIAAQALRWAPWAALLLLLPLLLFALFRGQKRNEDGPGADLNYDSGEKLTPPRYSDDTRSTEEHFDDTVTEKDLETSRELDSLNEAVKAAGSSSAPSSTVDVPSIQFDEDLLDEPEHVVGTSDLKPSTSDTQETIRPPELGEANAESTQILQEPEVSSAPNSNLLQEAEIYLAYEQFSLAEETINKLLAEDADNDRYKLLQLKLFSELGRMNELQSLSVDLLQKYPNPDNGMHQQVQNICERAFTRHAASEASTSAAIDSPPTAIDDYKISAPPADTLPDGEPIDVTLEALTVDTIFKEDIEDYLSDNTALALDNIDTELNKAQPESTSATLEEPADDLDLDQLTDEEMEALSQELDFPDDDLDELALEAIDDEDNPNVEKFSDTDLRLPAVKIDPGSPDLTGGLLDIELDLEAELEKANPKDKPD